MFYLCGLSSIVGEADGGSRSEEEEKVYSWLYTLAQSEKYLVFEYVRSTERGKCQHFAVLFQLHTDIERVKPYFVPSNI